MSSDENQPPRQPEAAGQVPIHLLVDWLNSHSEEISGDQKQLIGDVALLKALEELGAISDEELAVKKIQINRQLGDIGARQTMHGDLKGLLIALTEGEIDASSISGEADTPGDAIDK